MLAGLIEGLASEGIYVAPRLGRMRISPHVYNDEADADRFVEALASGCGAERRVGKGALAPCPPSHVRRKLVGTLRFAHPNPPSLRGAQRRSNPCFFAEKWIASLRSQ